MAKLSQLHYTIIGISLALVLTFGWALRLDHLRSSWKTKAEHFEGLVIDLTNHTQTLKSQRDAATNIVLAQSDQIIEALTEADRLKTEVARLQVLSDEQSNAIARLTTERDAWVKKAQAARNKAERLEAEAQARICDEAIDDVVKAGERG